MKYIWLNWLQWLIKMVDGGLYPRGGKVRMHFFFGLQVNEPYDWEGVGGGGRGLISGREGLETVVYGTE